MLKRFEAADVQLRLWISNRFFKLSLLICNSVICFISWQSAESRNNSRLLCVGTVFNWSPQLILKTVEMERASFILIFHVLHLIVWTRFSCIRSSTVSKTCHKYGGKASLSNVFPKRFHPPGCASYTKSQKRGKSRLSNSPSGLLPCMRVRK